MQMACGSTGFI